MRRGKGQVAAQLRVSNSQAALIVAFISAGLLFFALGRLSARFFDQPHSYGSAAWATVPKRADTLVVYTYANRDWEYPRNLAYFIQHGNSSAVEAAVLAWRSAHLGYLRLAVTAGIKEGDGADYVVILQQADHPVRSPHRSDFAGSCELAPSVCAIPLALCRPPRRCTLCSKGPWKQHGLFCSA